MKQIYWQVLNLSFLEQKYHFFIILFLKFIATESL